LSAMDNAIAERVLIEAAQADPRHFAELYEANFDRVYAFVARRTRSREQAEDITAELFQRALENLSRFEWRGLPFHSWLLRIAANLVADRVHRVPEESELPADIADATETEREIQRQVMLSKLVDGLPRDQRLVLVRRFVEEQSIREIAAELGRSEGAVKQLQFRALQTLREKTRGNHA
jgi:RNA polymerase sigma-70 factor (ECF subfamily)